MPTLQDIANHIGAELRCVERQGVEPEGAEPNNAAWTPIRGVASLAHADPEQLSFLGDARYRHLLATTRAAAVIMTVDAAVDAPVTALLSPNPQLAFARAAALFLPDAPPHRGVHSTACVSPTARVADDAWIGPHCVVEDGAVIEAGARIGPGCVIGAAAHIGRDAQLIARVTLCHGVTLGQRVLLHPGVVVGADGFGLANDAGRWVKIPQLGSVRIGDDVEIGANTTVDRGALDDTVLEEGVKLDNQIQVGHNVHIGAHTAIAGGVMIGGSTRIGRQCMIGGGSCISGHLEIADRVVITGMTGVSKSITEAGMYSSALTAEPTLSWNRIRGRLRRLEELVRRVGALERTLRGDKA